MSKDKEYYDIPEIKLRAVTFFTSAYVKELTAYALDMQAVLEEIWKDMIDQNQINLKLANKVKQLQKEVATAGNTYYQKDAQTMSKKYAELNRKLGEQERQSLHDLGQKEAEIVKLKSELSAANALLKTKDIQIETLRAQVEAYRKLPEPHPTNTQPKDSNGRFACAEDGQTGKSKQQRAYDMHLEGYRNKEIAEELGISAATVRVYISNEKSINSDSYNEEKELEAAHAMIARYPEMYPAF